jgi:hypothetical protein
MFGRLAGGLRYSLHGPFIELGLHRTITFLHVGQVSSPLDQATVSSVAEVGVEPTITRL